MLHVKWRGNEELKIKNREMRKGGEVEKLMELIS
jgi:hypothetical protein